MRWLGGASHVGLRHNLHCFALMVDPYVLSAYKAVCGEPALKRMLSSFQDKQLRDLIINYCGGTANAQSAILIAELNNYFGSIR